MENELKVAQSLPAPRVPAADDGIVDKADMENGNIAAVISYPNVKSGDFIDCYIDNNKFYELEVTDSDDAAFIAIINDEYLTNGSHVINYDITDSVGNTSKSYDLYFFVDRDTFAKKIDAPDIIGAVDGNISNDVINNAGGVYVKIQPNNTISKYLDNEMVLYWNEYDAMGVPISAGCKTYSIKIDQSIVNNGWQNFIDADIVKLADKGGVISFYYIQVGSERIYSETTIATIDNDGNIAYISLMKSDKDSIIADNKEVANIYAYIRNRKDDSPLSGVNVYWGTSLGTLSSVNSQSNAVGLASVSLSSNETGTAVITSRLDNGDERALSLVIYSADDILYAPEFLQAVDSVIESSSINDGVTIRINYSGMKVGDRVICSVHGTHSDGSDEPTATWQGTFVIDATALSLGYIILTMPSNLAISVGNLGYLYASYIVHLAGSSSEKKSATATAVLKLTEENNIRCYISTGAPVYDTATIDLHPCNQGVIFGDAGTPITLSCSDDAFFVESSTNLHNLTLDESGHGKFNIASPHTGAITVILTQTDKPSNNWIGATIFENYKVGMYSFKAYGYTTRAISDGVMHCSVYIITKPLESIKHVRITVDGDASIVGYPDTKTADILISSDYSAEMDITNKSAGGTNVILTLPESSGSELSFVVYFDSYNQYFDGGK